MVVSRIFGGLGNQLFCYAAARRLALVSDVPLVLDVVSGFVRDEAYRRTSQLDHFSIPCRKATPAERLEPYSRIRRAVKRLVSRARPFGNRTYIVQQGVDFDRRILDLRPGKHLYLEGYWQSERYFKDVESTIRDDLRIVPPVNSENLLMAERIRSSKNAVGLHARFFDAPSVSGGDNVPRAYYTRALALMEAVVPSAHYFVFSNQPGDVEELVSLPAGRSTLVSHNLGDDAAFADLWLMSQCHHFIIANSTFSWWGAWLAHHSDKIVIAPGYEKRAGRMWWGFDGLLPDEWIKL